MFTALYDNNIEIEDITRYIKRFGADSKDITLDTNKYLYLGTMLKFNHAFLSMVTESVAVNGAKVELYDGASAWNDVAHLVDETDGLSKDGSIEFIPNLDLSWGAANTEDIAELDSVKIYNRYWIRLSFDAETVAEIAYVGHKFSDDIDLFEEYTQLSNAQFLTYLGGTDYTKQAVRAGEIIEKDLVSMKDVKAIEQVLNIESLKLASVCKVAEIIYAQFGDEYRDAVAEIRKEYNTRLKKAFPIVDVNNTGEKTGNFAASVTIGELHR